MELINTLVIAVALAMDSFTVAISGGAVLKKIRIRNALLVGIYFGFSQLIMFLIGYIGGDRLRNHIDYYDHWIALGLLIIIGGKMIIESFSKSDKQKFSLKHKTLLILAIATSIDALGVGFSYSLLNKSLFIPSIIIGIIAFIFSTFGIYLGKIFKQVLKKKAEIFGGIILIAIGINIAIEHGAFNF
jgi:putative Mn2+ efflux pump MntP